MKHLKFFLLLLPILFSAQKISGVQLFNPQTNDETPVIKFGEQLILNFDDLTGFSLLDAEKQYKLRNKGVAVKELEDGWALTVAAKATGLKYGDFLKFKGVDYLKVVNTTKGFLNSGWDSKEDTENLENEEMEVQNAKIETE